MKNILLLILFLSSHLFVFAQQSPEEQSVVLPIQQLFEGMSKKDTVLLHQAFYNNARLATTGTDQTGTDQKGVAFFREESIPKFIQSIGAAPAELQLEERLLGYTIQIDDHLAIVRTPYEFYLNGKFSHCGVNVFELFHTPKGWKITSIIDTRKKENCPK